ncbi:hypothetical protein C0995_002006 [Termitomyces sp. Mi166|nr:hypothetical protein C0995_002006 [Termitomyces sp. Mi166\
MLLADFLLLPQMALKISLLKISADASLLECKHAAQEFIIAANTVFFKAQGLATLVPLHKIVFDLLEGLLDDWCLLNLDSVEWRHKAEVHQACINLWSLNKQVLWCAEFGKTVMAIELEPPAPVVAPRTVMDLVPTLASATLSIQHAPSIPYIVDPSTTFRVVTSRAGGSPCHTSIFVVPTKFDDKLLASLLPPLTEFYKRDVGLLQGAKILGGRKGDITLVSPATQALVLEKNGAPSMLNWPISKPIVALASQVAGPSTAQIVPSSAPKPAAMTTSSRPVPVKSVSKPAIKGGFIFKDPFMVRQFKLAGTEECGALIINQATEVTGDEDTSDKDENDQDSNDNEGGKGNNDNAAMDIDSSKRPEEMQPTVPTKTMVTVDAAPVPVPLL